MKKFNISLFIFRRDLRIQDNTGLIKAAENSNLVIPIFIFNKEQVDKQNKYRSEFAINFMIESLKDLDKSLNNKLYLFYGNNIDIIKKITDNLKIDAIFLNRDYTPYSKKRDLEILNFCKENSIFFSSSNDILLNEPEDVKNKSGKNYSVFTPFYKNCLKIEVKKPNQKLLKNFYKEDLKFSEDKSIYNKLYFKDKVNKIKGGRTNAKKILDKIKDYSNYNIEKNILEYSTTLLSAHNKFGTCSIREVYYCIEKVFGKNHDLIRQLYWRDFFTHITFNHPDIFLSSYKYKNIKWINNKNLFKAWIEGKTGFAIVDAGMRELNTTGYMHNRARLITSSFLVKDLHIDFKWGEKYFAQKLIDYDPSVNNGNWQWIASTGLSAQPYFRIINPWIEQKKFDSDCLYIKKWIPELRSLDKKDIHNLYKKNENIYIKPIVDHKKEAIKSKEYYRNSTKNGKNSILKRQAE